MFIYGWLECGWWFFWFMKIFCRLLNYVFNFVLWVLFLSIFVYEYGMEKSGSWVEIKL